MNDTELPQRPAMLFDEAAAEGEPARVFALPGAADEVLAAAADLARAAALEVGDDTVGEHLGVRGEAERVVTHAFAATLPGYVGWHWAVTVARAEGSEGATVDEVVLLPGEEALLAPAWVPWSERVQPGDLSPGDLLPTTEDDIRLVPAYVRSDDPQVEAVAFELGLGRETVLSRDGRELAAERWYTGDRGPDAPMARQAPAACGTCGFFLPLAGSLAAGFGVCGNEVVDSDGRVVSVEFGCGAHSSVRPPAAPTVDTAEVVFDDGEEISHEPRGPREIEPPATAAAELTDAAAPDAAAPDAAAPDAAAPDAAAPDAAAPVEASDVAAPAAESAEPPAEAPAEAPAEDPVEVTPAGAEPAVDPADPVPTEDAPTENAPTEDAPPSGE